MTRRRRVLLSILARVVAHTFPKPGTSPELLSQAWHTARVRIEAHRMQDEADRWDVDRRRRRAAIVERLLQGYSRSRGRKLTRAELSSERPVVH